MAVAPRVLLTARHACFEAGKPLQLKVLFMHGKRQLQELDVEVIRYSAQMDIAALAVLGPTTPFVPLEVATSDIIDDEFSNLPCALTVFDLPRDGSQVANVAAGALITAAQAAELLPALPLFQPRTVVGVDPLWRRAAGASTRDWRQYLVARADYFNEKGLSGGAVVGRGAQGQLVLLGVHISNEFLSPTEELEMRASDTDDSSYHPSGSDGDDDDDASQGSTEAMQLGEQAGADELADLAEEAKRAYAPAVPGVAAAMDTEDGAEKQAVVKLGSAHTAHHTTNASAVNQSFAPSSAGAASSAAAAIPHESSRSHSLSGRTDTSTSQEGATGTHALFTLKTAASYIRHHAGTQARGFFVVAHSLMAVHPKWSLSHLVAKAEKAVADAVPLVLASAASAAPARSSQVKYRFRSAVRPPQSSLRARGAPCLFLYDD